MRVGNTTYYRNTLNNVISLQQEQYRLGKEIDTGQRVNAPSDDSAYATTILNSRYSLEQVKQYRNNLETAQSWLTASENSMAAMVSGLTRARELAEQVSNGTYTADQHVSVASEIQRIISDLITLTNTSSNGSYIFGGTNSNTRPASEKLVMAYPATLNALGHGTSSLFVNNTLRFSRISAGFDATLQISAGNTLGSTNLGLDFSRDNWTISKQANSNQGQSLELNETFASGTSLVSDTAGESFSWLADSTAGWQTFRNWATITFSPGDTVTINGQGFTAIDANDLITQINNSANSGYSAVLDGADVKIISCGDVLNISAGASTINQDLTLDDFNAYLEQGLNAQGSLTIDGGAFSFPPKDTDYISLGDFKLSWQEIKASTTGNAFLTADDYAQALSNYLNSQTGQYTATVVTSGNLSTVQIQANVVGKAGNVAVSSSANCISSSGSLYGGMDPMGAQGQTPGHIYGTGYSDLNISTTIKGQVVATTTGSTGAPESVIIALNWIDDNGNAQHVEVDLRNAGESGMVNIPELGENFYLYRDGQSFNEGDTFEITLSYLQGNQEELNTLYSANNDLRYNWNASQLLGENMRIDLRGMETVPRNSNTGNGLVALSGFYYGFYSQDLTFDIIDGQLDNGMVLVRATWIDENGQQQQQTVALDSNGADSAVLPVLGDPPSIDLSGIKAVQTNGTSSDFKGEIIMSGTYRGLTSCDFNFTILEGGALNNDTSGNTPVKVQIDWVDDQGLAHSDIFNFECAGEEFAVEIPGAGGLSFYLDYGEYQAGDPLTPPDTFQHSVDIGASYTGDGFFFQIDPGTYQAGDSFFVSIEASEQTVLDILQQWCLALTSGDQELAQTWSQRALVELEKAQANILDYAADAGVRQNRITSRIGVLDAQKLFHEETLVALQEIDSTSALLQLQMIMSNYNDLLKVTSQVSDLFVLNYM